MDEKKGLSLVLLCPWKDIMRLSLVSPLRYMTIICSWELGYIYQELNLGRQVHLGMLRFEVLFDGC